MIQVLFFLRFRTQLRRTRPQLTFQLEKAIIEAIEASGGKVEHKRRSITGYFDKQALGIWLNIITLLEGITALLNEADSELYGYALVIGEDIEDYEQGWIGSNLAAKSGGTRIWCTLSVQPLLSPYVDFEDTEDASLEPLTHSEAASDEGEKAAEALPPLPSSFTAYVQVKRLGPSAKSDPGLIPNTAKSQDNFPIRDKILHIIRYGATKNMVLMGPAFMGKREGLYRFCTETLGDIPPLVLRFGFRKSLGYLADLLSPSIRALMEGAVEAELLEELDGLKNILFRERLMNEYSSYLLKKGSLFFKKVVLAYIAMAQYRNRIPILILEDINNADDTMTQLVLDGCKALEDKPELHIYGTYSYEPMVPGSPSLEAASTFPKENKENRENTGMEKINQHLRCWEAVFPKTLRFPPEYYLAPKDPEMPRDLWEVAYAADLLRPYFPGTLFPQLFEEEASTSAMALRAFTILSNLGIIDVIEDPVPRIPHFTRLAETWLGERKEHIRCFVRNRLLAWVLQGKFRSCFGMLEILAELGEQGDDELVLNAIYGDVIIGTYQGIEQAVKEDRFEAVVGPDKGSTLFYIFTTLKALLHGNEAEIQEAFIRPVPQTITFSGHKIHILVNLTCYYLGIKNLDTALEVIKEAMLIGQKQKQDVTRVYRLFSLVNLVRRQMDDAIDYISFGVENAERLEQFDTLAVSAYYAAIIQFLFGNLSWAEQLAFKAEQAAFNSEQFEWKDRIRFFRGKLRFEIGYYQDALHIFKSLKDNPAGSVSPEQDQILAAWIYRTMVYLGERNQKPVSLAPWQDPGLKVPSAAGDAFLFEVEASYITGDYQRTISLTETIPLHSQSPFLYTERPDWRSGFSQCELLLIEPQVLWERMLLTYRGLALCRISSPGASPEQTLKRIQHFIRNDLLPDRDIYDVFYFYAYYRMLKESDASDSDLKTVVSMAFKRLQSRANRIEDLETRRVFLNLHYWNNALSIVAKEHKLL
ncbi:MAG: hypothetical protein LBB80_11565 [Treponema sp.]|jgi:hypothetical protein|nr:hypothetical protein [Treponema sp.]